MNMSLQVDLKRQVHSVGVSQNLTHQHFFQSELESDEDVQEINMPEIGRFYAWFDIIIFDIMTQLPLVDDWFHDFMYMYTNHVYANQAVMFRNRHLCMLLHFIISLTLNQGIIYPEIKILSKFTNPHVFPNLYVGKHKRKRLALFWMLFPIRWKWRGIDSAELLQITLSCCFFF